MSNPDEVIIWSNNGGKDHIGLLSGNGALCGYTPDVWVGTGVSADIDTITENHNVCKNCLKTFQSRQ